jgi:DNA-binding transcriptional regulator YiaG
MNSIDKLKYIESIISRKELARRIGVRYNSVYRWIAGRSDPDKSRSKVTVKAIDALFRELGGKE